jgi:hypothetical protein
MLTRTIVLAAASVIISSNAFAQGSSGARIKSPAGTERAGSAEDQAACRPDVRKYCYKLAEDAGDLSFLACLKENREKLGKPCLAVLERNGQ